MPRQIIGTKPLIAYTVEMYDKHTKMWTEYGFMIRIADRKKLLGGSAKNYSRKRLKVLKRLQRSNPGKVRLVRWVGTIIKKEYF